MSGHDLAQDHATTCLGNRGNGGGGGNRSLSLVNLLYVNQSMTKCYLQTWLVCLVVFGWYSKAEGVGCSSRGD